MWRLWRLFTLREAMKTPVDSIIRMVARYYNLSLEDVLGPCKAAPLVTARFMAVWLIRNHLKLCWEATARSIGYMDHGSAMNGYKRISGWMEVDPVLRKEGAKLLAQLTSRTTSEG